MGTVYANASLNLAFDIIPLSIENDRKWRRKRDIFVDGEYNSVNNHHGLFKRQVTKMTKLDREIIDYAVLDGKLIYNVKYPTTLHVATKKRRSLILEQGFTRLLLSLYIILIYL